MPLIAAVYLDKFYLWPHAVGSCGLLTPVNFRSDCSNAFMLVCTYVCKCVLPVCVGACMFIWCVCVCVRACGLIALQEGVFSCCYNSRTTCARKRAVFTEESPMIPVL